MSNIYEKLSNIQNELKAPKNQRNSFGNYNYRSCEDILEAVKPLCREHGCLLTISDEIVNVGDRYYIMAITRLINVDDPNESISNTAYARESLDKKGMDESQITGACSSYARKYALNGLFCIDDTKDADTDDFAKRTKEYKISQQELDEFDTSIAKNFTDEEILNILGKYGYNNTSQIEPKNFGDIKKDFKELYIKKTVKK